MSTHKKENFRLLLLLILSLVGAGISVFQTHHFYLVRNGLAGFQSFCNVNATINCDAVEASRFAEFAFGIPLSSFAAAWFLAIALISGIARNAFWRRECLRVLFGMTAFSTLMTVLYLSVMAIVLKTFCLLCLGIDAINLVSLGLVLSLKPEGFAVHRPDREKWKWLFGSSAALICVLPLALMSLDTFKSSESSIDELVKNTLSHPAVAVASGPEFPSFGPDNAPITIVEFSDFQCPYCKIGATTLHAVLNRYPKDVRVVFRSMPLDMSCNRFIQRPMHTVACEAARVAQCAYKQGKFDQVYETIFENQADLKPGSAVEIARSKGMDPQALDQCTSSPAIQAHVAADIEEANRLEVHATPTFFINGHKVEGPYPVSAWSRIIEILLKDLKSQKPITTQ